MQLNKILLISDNKSPKLRKNNKINVQASIQKPTDNKSKESNIIYLHINWYKTLINNVLCLFYRWKWYFNFRNKQ